MHHTCGAFSPRPCRAFSGPQLGAEEIAPSFFSANGLGKRRKVVRVSKSSVKVFVGYGWQKFEEHEKAKKTGREVLSDAFWNSLREKFESFYTKGKADGGADTRRVEINRLRASIGQYILQSIARKIERADILIFDIADVRNVVAAKGRKKDRSFNANVLLEVGIAMGLKKENIILMCPEHIHLPSDLAGILVAKYTAKWVKGTLVRTFADEIGVATQYRGMLRRVCLRLDENEKGEAK